MRSGPMAALAVLACAQATALGAQQPTFSTRVDAVRDNSVSQRVEVVSLDQIPLNIVVAFDVSGSVTGERLDHLRRAGEALLNTLTDDDHAALVTFSHVIVQRSGLTKDRARVRSALALSPAAGETALIDGIYTGLMLGESNVGRALLMVFSDGLDTASWLASEPVLDIARRSDTVVYTMSVGQSYRSAFLRNLSEPTGESLLRIESTKVLGAAFVRILDEFRQRYLLTYSPRGVAPDGWHRLEVRVKRRNATVKARPGYLAGPGG